MVEIDFKKLNLKKIGDDVNLLLYNSPLFNVQDMKETNKLLNKLKNIKIKINVVNSN